MGGSSGICLRRSLTVPIGLGAGLLKDTAKSSTNIGNVALARCGQYYMTWSTPSRALFLAMAARTISLCEVRKPAWAYALRSPPNRSQMN